jgi:transcriptional regulator with XRE-family HTH domain
VSALAYNISHRLNGSLHNRGWTTASIAAYLDVDPSAVRRWRSGICTPTTDDVERICQLTGIRYEYLITGG